MKNVKDMTPYELRKDVMQTVARNYKLGARTANYEITMKRITDAINIAKEVRDDSVTDSMFPYRPEDTEQELVRNARKSIYDAINSLKAAKAYLYMARDVTHYAATQLEMELSEALKVD